MNSFGDLRDPIADLLGLWGDYLVARLRQRSLPASDADEMRRMISGVNCQVQGLPMASLVPLWG